MSKTIGLYDVDFLFHNRPYNVVDIRQSVKDRTKGESNKPLHDFLHLLAHLCLWCVWLIDSIESNSCYRSVIKFIR